MEGAIEGALRLKALCFGTGEASSGRREDARERHHLTITTRRCQVDVRARPAGERERARNEGGCKWGFCSCVSRV